MKGEDTVKIFYIDTTINKHKSRTYTALIKSEIVGIITLDLNSKEAGYISSLYISRKFRRQGIGTQLINKCCADANDKKCKAVSLTVLKTNKKAISMYQRLGFIIVYEYDDDSYLMSINIKEKE